jgi:primosomal protein N'
LADQVAIFHSSLQKGERFDEWTRVRNGEARVVIGTRSAVFAPVKNLGLIVVDEEHEASYRQQESPYYNARDVAIVRAQKESATVVLGSATPSLESFHNARKGKYHFVALPERIGARPMAEAKIVDMRNVFVRHGKPRVFSDELLEAIRETRERGEQSIILLNAVGTRASYFVARVVKQSVSELRRYSNLPSQRARDRLSLLQSPRGRAARLSLVREEIHLLCRRRHGATRGDAQAAVPCPACCAN